jgi:glycosyltransferase involved in cell wall biosynthesis
MKVSLIVPVFNEEESLEKLHQELCDMCKEQSWEVEMLFIDDGSTDGSHDVLLRLAEKDERVRILKFSRNFGQTAGLSAGIEYATGEVIVPMDADLQNDPADVPRLVERLNDGYDVVSGWRKHRQDKALTRRLPSVIANRILSRWTGVKLHDYGCTLKAYRASVLKGTSLYGEMHRFVPVYASWRGAKVTEMVVNHRARQFGQSKYGLSRTYKVLLDMITLKLLGSYSTKPIYLFGGLGAISMVLGLLCFGGVVVEKLIWDVWIHKMSMLLLSSFLVMIGVLLVMIGLLAELVVRTYHESQNKRIYVLDSEVHPESSRQPEVR